MNPFKDLNSTPEALAIANQYTHTKSESEMIAEYLARYQLKDSTCNSQH